MNTFIENYLPNLPMLMPELNIAFVQTITMVSIAFLFSLLLGLPLGIVLAVTKNENLLKAPRLYFSISFVIDIFRSTPTLILITAIGPFTRFVVGTKIGVKGAIVPLVIASAPFLARQIEAALSNIDNGIIEAAKSMGNSLTAIIFRALLPESLSSLINAFTITFVSLINFSAIAGAVGGGGLGDFALRYGYQQFRTDIMIVTIIILLSLVSAVQLVGKYLSQKFKH